MTTQRSGKTRLGVTARLAAVMALAIAVTATPVIPIGDADAAPRAGFGSRGTKTFQAPPSTRTAPTPPSSIDRTTAPRPAQQPGVAAPGTAGQQAARPGLFGGMGGALLGGLALGGLFGMLFGGGFGGLAGFFGMLLQVALIAGVVMLALRFFRNRNQQPAYGSAGAHERSGAGGPSPTGPTTGGPLSGGLAGLGASLGGLGQRQATPAASGPADEIGLQEADFNTFERLLGEVETAYSTGDVGKLRQIATPEAASYLNDQIDENEAKGVVNEVRDVKLLQGDLAEAWREGDLEYATVALRFSMIDVTRDKATGRVLDGDPTKASELTQVWTFVREPAAIGSFDQWRLSAIQDT